MTTTTKAAHTPGPVGVAEIKAGHFIVQAGDIFIAQLYTKRQALLRGKGPENPQADAELIAEAFNVATETGMTPRQLAEKLEEETRSAYAYRLSYEEARAARDDLEAQRAELLAALEKIASGKTEHPEPFHEMPRGEMQLIARAVIAKVKGAA